MAEQTQTEKLRKAICAIIKKRKELDFEEYCVGFNDYKIEDEILKVCKEAGLMFTKVGVKGDLEGACICKVGEIII